MGAVFYKNWHGLCIKVCENKNRVPGQGKLPKPGTHNQ